ncbi:hypothetical protein ACFY5K_25790 [Streptomyces griseofuscus]|uniref:hypothetical protein n=1 Tax=Streptomyces griseofuscus TaxID=146922 RepID=UPI0036ABF944
MQKLPDDLTLMVDRHRGLDQGDIAKKYNVSPQAVSERFGRMGIRERGAGSPVTSLMPWDLSDHPEKRKLVNSSAYRCARDYLRKKRGERMSDRAAVRAESFERRLADGFVLSFTDDLGFHFSKRKPGEVLIFRWPEGMPVPGDAASKAALYYITEEDMLGGHGEVPGHPH